MKVPMLDPARMHESYQKELEDAALRVLRSGKYILGQEVELFEDACAKYIGAKHAIGVSSGTDALLVSLMALGIGPGDEVICPSFTFFATAGSIARAGATPIFADILPECFTLDPEDVERRITSKTKAIIPVHLFGQCADMTRLLHLAQRHNLYVVEDVAQAIGASLAKQNVKAGAMGDLGCFSFFPSKNLGGFGDAGLVTTNSGKLAARVRSLRNHGQAEQYVHTAVGGNFRIDALQAALLSVKLKHLPEAEAQRVDHADMYSKALDSAYFWIPEQIRGHHVYNQFTIRVPGGKRDMLKKHLENRDIGCAIYYPLPLHAQPCFDQSFELPVTDFAVKECLSLPIAAELTRKDIQITIAAIRKLK